MILKPFAHGAMLSSYGYDLDAFPFDDAYLDKLLGFLGRDRAGTDLEAFAEDHFNLLYVFVQARRTEARYPSVSEENKALRKAQDAAWKLREALEAVRRTGEAGERLIEESATLAEPRFARNGMTLADLFTGPAPNPHRPLRALLLDLRVALERARIEKPRPLVPVMHGWGTTSAKVRGERLVRFAAQDADAEARYRERIASHGLIANSALASFGVQLWDFWRKYTDLPFTEGRYEGKGIGNNSATLDFAETCLRAFGAKYRRSLIAQKLRDVREAMRSGDAQ